ncbi:MAG: hypothetical protein N2117_02865 [Anaerolineales bacterium]|nr:hypothetical protein [Anaerolineales bacterium]MCX7754175.1 hypothetical protein [Anaerolineales bacterium]MDW8276975.1 hypothetical protein [Anaerolineales bacterium]
MNELRTSFILLVLYLLALFAVGEVFDNYGLIFEFPTHFYFLIVAVVGTNIFVPRLSWMSVTPLLGFWAFVFFIIAYFYIQVNGLGSLQVLGIEFILVEVAVWMSYHLNSQLRAVEALMDNLASATYTNRTLDLRQATERIKVEMTRSRRHHHPLSVILLKPEKITSNEDQKAYKLMREDLLRHFASARIGQIMTNELRQTDLILRAPEGHFIILCAETPRESSVLLAERLQEAIDKEIGASVEWSVASFPDEALTFEELLNKAYAALGKNKQEEYIRSSISDLQKVEKH